MEDGINGGGDKWRGELVKRDEYKGGDNSGGRI